MAGQDLTGNQISTTYKSLLKTTDNAELPTSGKVRITDGKGNDSSLFIAQGTGGAQVCGNFSVTGDSSANRNNDLPKSVSCGVRKACMG